MTHLHVAVGEQSKSLPDQATHKVLEPQIAHCPGPVLLPPLFEKEEALRYVGAKKEGVAHANLAPEPENFVQGIEKFFAAHQEGPADVCFLLYQLCWIPVRGRCQTADGVSKTCIHHLLITRQNTMVWGRLSMGSCLMSCCVGIAPRFVRKLRRLKRETQEFRKSDICPMRMAVLKLWGRGGD